MTFYSFDLERFARNHLHGDARNLASLSFTDMLVIPHVYDFPLEPYADCDETNIAWEVYNRVWGLERKPAMHPSGDDGIQPQWRGDTMNSFRTIFGREIEVEVTGGDGVIGFDGLRRFGVEDELFKTVHKFWYTYHMIGNFIPLPNAKSHGKTINTYRTAWHDYFDSFLINLHDCLTGNSPVSDSDKASLPDLVAKNSFFWDAYRGDSGWERFIREFMLEDYCDADLRPKKLYTGLWYWKRGLSRDEYKKACYEYIEKATTMIVSRGKRMMDVACDLNACVERLGGATMHKTPTTTTTNDF